MGFLETTETQSSVGFFRTYIIIIMTSIAPISSKIKLSGTTKPRD